MRSVECCPESWSVFLSCSFFPPRGDVDGDHLLFTLFFSGVRVRLGLLGTPPEAVLLWCRCPDKSLRRASAEFERPVLLLRELTSAGNAAGLAFLS